MAIHQVMNSWNILDEPRTKTFKSLAGWFSSDSPKEVGKRLFTAYFNVAVNFPQFGYIDYDAWMTALNTIIPDFEEFVGGLVLSNYAATSVGQAESRLTALADQSGGTATQTQMVQAAGGSGNTVNWAAGIPEVFSHTASDIADIAATQAQNIKTGVLGTFSLVKYLPWILGGAAVIYLLPQIMGGVSALKSGGKSA